MAEFKVKLNGQEVDVKVTRQGDNLRVTYGGKTADLRLLHTDGPRFVLEYKQPDGRCQRIRAAGYIDSGGKRQMWVNGRAFTYERVRQRAKATAGAGSLSSSIPAVVTELLVHVGDAVAAGDKLILLESMKMVIPILAPCEGTVTAINCAAGESVAAGVPLVELEELV